MPQDDIFYGLYERYQELLCETLREYRRKQHTDEYQDWEVVKAADLKLLWTEFMTTGLVLKRRLFEKVRDRIVDNILKLRVNTELCGHTQLSPEEVAEGEGYDGFDFDKNNNFFLDPKCGQWRISDYALDHLFKLALELRGEDTEEKQLVVLDRILQVSHMRSDLASWMVEGGSKTLTKLSEE